MNRKIACVVTALVAVCATLVGIGATSIPANAAGCGDVQHRSSAVSTGNDNLLIAGRPIVFKLHMDQRDCDGYDLITEVWATIHKDGGNCKNVWATTDGYRTNPNVIGNANPPTIFSNCVGGLTSGQTDYFIAYNVYEKITSNMPESDRCLAMIAEVDLVAQTDPPDMTTPTMCVNGL